MRYRHSSSRRVRLRVVESYARSNALKPVWRLHGIINSPADRSFRLMLRRPAGLVRSTHGARHPQRRCEVHRPIPLSWRNCHKLSSTTLTTSRHCSATSGRVVRAPWVMGLVAVLSTGIDVHRVWAISPQSEFKIVARQLSPVVVSRTALSVPAMAPPVSIIAKPREEVISEHVCVSDVSIDPSNFMLVAGRPTVEAVNGESNGIGLASRGQDIAVPQVGLQRREANWVWSAVAAIRVISDLKDRSGRSANVLETQRHERLHCRTRRSWIQSFVIRSNDGNEVRGLSSLQRQTCEIGRTFCQSNLALSGIPQLLSGPPQKPGENRQGQRRQGYKRVSDLELVAHERRPKFGSLLFAAIAMLASIPLLARGLRWRDEGWCWRGIALIGLSLFLSVDGTIGFLLGLDPYSLVMGR